MKTTKYLIANNSFGYQMAQAVENIEQAENILKGFEAFGGPNNEFPHAAVWDMDLGVRLATLRQP